VVVVVVVVQVCLYIIHLGHRLATDTLILTGFIIIAAVPVDTARRARRTRTVLDLWLSQPLPLIALLPARRRHTPEE
jgi:hypothetical protein